MLCVSHGLAGLPAVYWSSISAFVQEGYVVLCPTHNDGTVARGGMSDGVDLPFMTDAMAARALHGLDLDDAAGAAAWAGFDAAAAPAEQQVFAGPSKVMAWREAQLQRRAAELLRALDWLD